MLPVGGKTMHAMALPWVLAALLGAGVLALAESADAEEYWIAPMGNACEITTVVMINTGSTDAAVLLERADGWSKAITIDDLAFVEHDIGCALETYRVDAPDEVEVQFYVNRGGGSLPASGAMIPFSEMGKVHRTVASGEGELLQILGVHDSTTVTVIAAGSAGPGVPGALPSLSPGSPTTFMLDRFDFARYQVNDPGPVGSWIISDKPIAVYAAGHGNPGPPDSALVDGIASPIFPAAYAGSEYVVCATSGHRANGADVVDDVVRIVPLSPGITHVDFEPPPVGIPAGGIDIDATVDPYYEFLTSTDTMLTAEQPIVVGHYQDASTTVGGDPAGEMLIPIDLYRRSAAVASGPAYQGQTPSWFLQVVQVATPVGSDATMNGEPFIEWRSVGTSGFQCGWKEMTVPNQPYFLDADDPAMFVAHGYTPPGMFDKGYMHLLWSGCLPAGLPGAPTGLSASAVEGDVSLAWMPSGKDGGCPITEQRVYRKTEGLPWTQILSLPPMEAAATDTVSLSCDPYRYRVTAVSAAGESAPSNVASVYHRGLPEAPMGLKVYAQDGEQWTLVWDPPLKDGGCPVQHYVVYGPGGAVAMSPYFVTRLGPCASATFVVAAVTEVGEGPVSGPLALPAVGGLDCLPPVKAKGPDSSDADGDGVPDVQDDCPAVAALGGCVAAAHDPLRGSAAPCSIKDLLPRQARAAWTEADVLVSWEPPDACALDRFLVWNGTGHDLVAVVPFEEGRRVYDSSDMAAWRMPHRYFVQAEPEPGPDTFSPDRAVPTGLVRGPVCLGCAVDPALNMEDGVARRPAAEIPDPERLPATTWPWLFVVLVLLGILWTLLRNGGLMRLFTRLDRDNLEDHPLRAQIMDLVRLEPGMHTAGLATRLGRSTGAVRHHLRLLTAAGLLRDERLGGRMGYFAADVLPLDRRAALASRSGSARRVLDAIRAAPGTNLSDLSSRLALSHTSVTHHVRSLQRAGIVTVERSAGEVKVRPSKSAQDSCGQPGPG